MTLRSLPRLTFKHLTAFLVVGMVYMDSDRMGGAYKKWGKATVLTNNVFKGLTEHIDDGRHP